MTTLVDFTPSTLAPFQFQATLAGAQYTVTVLWNIFGQRYYIRIADLSGNVILYRALTGSGPTLAATLTWSNGLMTIATAAPHNVPVGALANITVSHVGSTLDGDVQALATGPSTLTYALQSNDPFQGTQSTPQNAVIGFGLNLVGGYGLDTLLWHDSTQQFEYGVEV
jgi:hypothetical protein